MIHEIGNRVVLIDASPLLYIHGANPLFKRSLKDHIESILNNLSSNQYIGILDGSTNFRKEVAITSEYKGNRTKTNILDTFPYFYEVKQELIDTYGMRVVNGVEADDILGILNNRINSPAYAPIFVNGSLTMLKRTSYNAVMASIDKDLLQLPGLHYNLKSHTIEESSDDLSYIELNEKKTKLSGVGFKFLYAQILMGDSTDNIKGLPGCGMIGTYKILNEYHTEKECELAVINAYKNWEIDDYFKKLNNKDKDPDVEFKMMTVDELMANGLKKYNETKTLVYILRNSSTLGDVEIKTYTNFN